MKIDNHGEFVTKIKFLVFTVVTPVFRKIMSESFVAFISANNSG
jgi:hypothetical protein